jgi:hypothetical protein
VIVPFAAAVWTEGCTAGLKACTTPGQASAALAPATASAAHVAQATSRPAAGTAAHVVQMTSRPAAATAAHVVQTFRSALAAIMTASESSRDFIR